ncbi:hypothetical protein LPB140_02610 [Sphingorhabdus lutea]|uniref:Flagellar protein FliS n=1 Tax=Sphingorhabdus lutea TaxID=1913578 RepID=A0A1L3J9V1_9SPHN|nr:hypothetical protein [Sphingorhabdus lutea]APG61898.1 hypothetical protein LPB140_02610 [Sphingorhabdus lutea]
MNLDHDRYLLVRAQLAEIIDSLEYLNYADNQLGYILKLEHIRDIAMQYGMAPIGDISMIFENALGKLNQCQNSQIICQAYIGILRDAVACQRISNEAARAMLGSVAMRLHA